MKDALPRRRGVGAPVCSVLGLLLAGLLLILGLAAIGCGGGVSETGTTAAATTETATATGATTATTAAGTDMGPSELADAIVATWTEAMQKLNGLLEGMPEPAKIQTQVEDLKEEYIQKFVELGRVKEGFSDSDKASTDSRTLSKLTALGSEPWYATYAKTQADYIYMSGNVDFTNLLASFNIITQYADFTLLKAQEPEEAARLGIE